MLLQGIGIGIGTAQHPKPFPKTGLLPVQMGMIIESF